MLFRSFGFSTRIVIASFYYKTFTGFYIQNAKNVFPAWQKTDNYPQRKDIQMQKIGMELFYVFNYRKYSIHAALKQTERQKKNTASLLLKTDAQYLKITGDSSLYPVHYSSFIPVRIHPKSITYESINLLVGYTYSIIFRKKFFIVPFVFAGPGFGRMLYENKNIETKNVLNMKTNIKISIGYNGNTIFANLLFDYETGISAKRKVSVSSPGLFYKIAVGIRFGNNK